MDKIQMETTEIDTLPAGTRRWLNGLNDRLRRITTRQPIEVRREYMPQDVKVTPLYLATRLHIAELWLEMQR